MILKRNPYLMIPLFLNLILLTGIPYFDGSQEVVRLAPLLVFALALPWILYFVIGRILESVARQAREKGNGDEDSDFI
ncbi:MAG: hypothetical protein ABFS42_08130 [Candidatus Krumholzibacteriota bacterium]